MINLTFFETSEELQQLTGIETYDGLWDAGFDMDDWDWGFVSDEQYDTIHLDKYANEYSEVKDDAPAPIWWLLTWMGYHNDWTCTEYNGKYYYILYH